MVKTSWYLYNSYVIVSLFQNVYECIKSKSIMEYECIDSKIHDHCNNNMTKTNVSLVWIPLSAEV